MTQAAKTVVFDWNGTLLNDTPVTLGGMNATLEAFDHKPIDEARFRESYDIPIARYYKKVGFSDAEISAHDFKMVNIFHDYYAENASASPLYDGVAQLLADLRAGGTHLLILSNHLREAIVPFLDQYGIAGLFDEVMAYEDRKTQLSSNFFPEKENKKLTKGEKLRLYVKEKKLTPTDIVVVGDTPEETHIARDIGAYSLALTYGYASRARLDAVKPDLIADTLDGLRPFLKAKGFLP